ncbi:hypothetical protein WS50_03365 [Burkholderia territorii]|nr:hypothetical protein WS50_03365 [Burkholderia territorii]
MERLGQSWTTDVDQAGSIKATMYGCRPVWVQMHMADLIGTFKCQAENMKMSILVGGGVDLWI